jgi:hypothetical protein
MFLKHPTNIFDLRTRWGRISCRLAVPDGGSAFVHFVARYQWQESPEIIEHIKEVSGFAEVCLVDGLGGIHSVRSRNREFVVETEGKETRVEAGEQLASALSDSPRTTGGDAADLTAMRRAMEEAVAGRILIGGQVSGYRGIMPGIIEEAQNTLDSGHLLIAIGGFGGAARDVALALGMNRISALSIRKLARGTKSRSLRSGATPTRIRVGRAKLEYGATSRRQRAPRTPNRFRAMSRVCGHFSKRSWRVKMSISIEWGG